MRRFRKAFSLNAAIRLRPAGCTLPTWHRRNSLKQNETGLQNEIGLLDSHPGRSLYASSSGVPVALTGQEGIRCAAPLQRQRKSEAAPATVGGEPFSYVPLDLAAQGLGRRRRVTTREPGDLPERGHPTDVRWARLGDIRCGDKSTCHADGGRHDDACPDAVVENESDDNFYRLVGFGSGARHGVRRKRQG